MSTSERTQPTLPGVEEMATPSVGLVEDQSMPGEMVAPVADLAPPNRGGLESPSTLARMEPRDAPYCYNCGNAMQRAGSCYVCSSCGSTSGCS